MAIPSIPKPLIMLPLMYYSRGLDSEDTDLVFKLRASFYSIHVVLLSLGVILYFYTATFLTTKEAKNKVYAAIAASPFAPDAKKKYNEVNYGDHVWSAFKSMMGGTCFHIVLQTGLFWYKGTIGGLFIQSIMAPINFLENPLTKFFFFGDKNAFDTKKKEELTDEDVIVDAEGNPLDGNGTTSMTAQSNQESTALMPEKKTFEDVMLDTWDLGAEADIKLLMAEITTENINFKTGESSWTPIMIMAGLGVKETATALKKMKELGADPSMVDAEGWNALHWSAFHGSAAAAEVLLASAAADGGFDGVSIGLHLVKDKEGKTALEHAEAEDNLDVFKIIEASLSNTADFAAGEETISDEGLRKRK